MSDSKSHHVIDTKKYVGVFVALLALTVFTVYTAKFVDLGSFNLTLAMVIALIKGGLVIAIFMGLLWDRDKISTYAFAFSAIFFAIFLALCMIDVVGREKVVLSDATFSDGYAPIVEGLQGSSSDRENFMTIAELLELRRQINAGETPELDLSK